MSFKIKGNVQCNTAHSMNNNVGLTVNNVSPDSNGNVEIEFDDYMSGDTGDTLIFKQNDIFKMSKLVNVAYIIMLDAELEACKAAVSDNIYDMRNGAVWVKSGSTWSIDSTSTLYTKLDKGSIFTNTVTNRAFLINENNTVSLFSGTSKGTALGQVPGIENYVFGVNASTGFISQRLPSGLVIQSIDASSGSDGVAVVNLQTPLTKVLSVQASPTTITANTGYIIGYDESSSTGSVLRFNTRVCVSSDVSVGAVNFKVLVIGY